MMNYMKRIPGTGKFSLLKFGYSLGAVVAVILFTGLVYSFISSGYHYQFDIDELFYSQLTYLYMHGYRPYLDVYTSVYPPVFQWFAYPVFWLKGFTFDAIYAGRAVMILLLAIRLTCSFFIVKTIFSKRAAFLFLPLFLFDPLAAFTGMQFRPDNLMLTLYAVGLLLFTLGLTRNNSKYLASAGFFFGLSVLVLPKVVPGLFVLGVVFFLWSLYRRRFRQFIPFALAGLVPASLFCLYLLSQGSLAEMVTQMFVESKLLYTNFAYPIPIYAIMKPENIFIFGTMGKPMTWVYLLLIIPMGLMGVYHALRQVLATDREKSPEDMVIVILGLSFLAQWAVLFAVQVAFMQHYMPTHWFAAVFTAFAVDGLLAAAARYRYLSPIVTIVCIGLFVSLALTSTRLNFARATIRGLDTQLQYEKRWSQLPAARPVFTGFLFRLPSYPVPFGGFIVNIPVAIINRLPDMTDAIKRTDPVMLINDYTLFRLPVGPQLYITDHYKRIPGDDELMTAK
jgi:hypothetical protein